LSEFLQTAGVVDFILTGAPELACAATGNGEIPKILLGIESNSIVCAAPGALAARLTNSTAKPRHLRLSKVDCVSTGTPHLLQSFVTLGEKASAYILTSDISKETLRDSY
jgi:hypothetical protein